MAGNSVKRGIMAYPVRIWSGSSSNRCSFAMIPSYWNQYDVLTFILDLGNNNTLLTDFLDDREKEKVLHLKTGISRMRHIVSRSVLKHIVSEIIQEKNVLDIVLLSRATGGIYVKDHPAISVSLSYSGTSIAITVGKVKVGSDIEIARPVEISKIKFYPIFTGHTHVNEKGGIPDILRLWTLIEAYSKLQDRNPYSLLSEPCLPTDAHFISYSVNNRSVFSLASRSDGIRDALVWIDSESIGSCLF
jgi:phosphopantetheinyl transferase